MHSTCRKPEDNIGKVICDALNGLAWYDDTQVVEAYVIKRYADIPMVRVMIDEA
jgi:Holliday junction resolvase RusA-like endonuclease